MINDAVLSSAARLAQNMEPLDKELEQLCRVRIEIEKKYQDTGVVKAVAEIASAGVMLGGIIDFYVRFSKPKDELLALVSRIYDLVQMKVTPEELLGSARPN